MRKGIVVSRETERRGAEENDRAKSRRRGDGEERKAEEEKETGKWQRRQAVRRERRRQKCLKTWKRGQKERGCCGSHIHVCVCGNREESLTQKGIAA